MEISVVVELPYGNGVERVRLPGDGACEFLDVEDSPGGGGQDLVLRAIAESRPGLDSHVKSGDSVALVVSDYSRATGTEVYVPLLVDAMMRNGVKADRITIIVALGLHRPATIDEMRTLVTPDVYSQVRVVNHDPDADLLAFKGTALSQHLLDADKIILTGSVTFHPMAGFSGGYKSILPGVASRGDIIRNHEKFFSGVMPHPGVGPGMVDDNPVLGDILVRCRPLHPVYCLNVVLDQNKQITFASAGLVEDAWGACCRHVRSCYSLVVNEVYPLVIASAGGFPADYSFYQCMKVLSNASRACEAGGDLVILAECSHGWEIDRELFSMFSLTMEDAAAGLLQDFRMDALAVYMARRVIGRHRVHFHSSLPPDEVAATGMMPTGHLETTINDRFSGRGKFAVIPHGAKILPVLEQRME